MSHCRACDRPLSQSAWGYNPDSGAWEFNLCSECEKGAQAMLRFYVEDPTLGCAPATPPLYRSPTLEREGKVLAWGCSHLPARGPRE